MATTDLKLDAPGTLTPPGLVGRLVRLLFGALCIWYAIGLVAVQASPLDQQGHLRELIWNGILPGLFLVSYIINIGFSRSWKKWPAIASAGVILALAAIGMLRTGSAETVLLARTMWVWLFYLSTRLARMDPKDQTRNSAPNSDSAHIWTIWLYDANGRTLKNESGPYFTTKFTIFPGT